MTTSVHFPGYKAKSAEPKSFPVLREAVNYAKSKAKSLIYDRLLYRYGSYKHQQLLKTSNRVSTHTYTCFYRAPAQLRALSGPAIDFLNLSQQSSDRLDIVLFACSNGSEAYTIASWLIQEFPTLNFHIHASDLHQELVDYASAARYTHDQVWHSDYITKDFVDATFNRTENGDYLIRPQIRAKVSFQQANLLDENLHAKFVSAQIVIAQNVLFHLSPSNATKAFENILSVATQKAVFLIEGMDLSLRSQLTAQAGLMPLMADGRQIYEETRVHTPKDWWRYYWGVEPYIENRADRDLRYSTIFARV